MKRIIIVCTAIMVISVSILAASKKADPAAKTKIIVAVAANFVLPMNEIKRDFEKEDPSVDIEIIPGASGKLAAQIQNGAPFEIFASADMDFPLLLKEKGYVEKGPAVYAQGSLVLFSASGIDLRKGLSVLKDGSVKKIVIANPETAPYGKAAVSAMKKCGIYEEVKHKLVTAENINKVMSIVINAADAGITARSALYDPLLKDAYKENVHWILIDQTLYEPLKQGAVLLRRGKINAKADLLYEYLFSEKTKGIYLKYGYTAK
jgi:molybdate transport system substrate-binding protein